LITVIDIKIGNVASVVKAIEKLGFSYQVTNDPEVINKASKIILIGVGSFREASKRINSSGIYNIVRYKVLNDNIPILGICLGMQLLASNGLEGGVSQGFGLVQGKVEYLRSSSMNLRVPHVGWNKVNSRGLSLFKQIPENSHYYFVHSYELILEEDIPIATCNYGIDFVAAIQKNNIMGTQFHPEKSQTAGLSLIQNFLNDA